MHKQRDDYSEVFRGLRIQITPTQWAIDLVRRSQAGEKIYGLSRSTVEAVARGVVIGTVVWTTQHHLNVVLDDGQIVLSHRTDVSTRFLSPEKAIEALAPSPEMELQYVVTDRAAPDFLRWYSVFDIVAEPDTTSMIPAAPRYCALVIADGEPVPMRIGANSAVFYSILGILPPHIADRLTYVAEGYTSDIPGERIEAPEWLRDALARKGR